MYATCKQQNNLQQSYPCPCTLGRLQGITMPRFNTPCLTCGRLSKAGSRCEDCTRKYNQAKAQRYDTEERREKKKLLYNADYRRRAKVVKATATHCHICRQPFTVADKIEADHLLPGNPDSPLAAAHRQCNQSRGDKPL